MQQVIVPTSPKSPLRQHHQQTDAGIRFGWRWAVILALIINGGLITALFALWLVTFIPPAWPVFGQLNWKAALTHANQVSFIPASSSTNPVNPDNFSNAVVSLYNDTPTFDQPAEILGNAIAITSDGWLVTTQSVVDSAVKETVSTPAAASSSDNQVVRTKRSHIVARFSDGTIALVKQTIPDLQTGIVFLQVDQTIPTIAQLSTVADLPTNQWVSVVWQEAGNSLVYPQRVLGQRVLQPLQTTAQLTTWEILDSTLPKNLDGAGVFLSDGTVTGIVGDKHQLIPAAIIVNSLASVVDKGTLTHDWPVVQYVNLAQLTSPEREQRQVPPAGILIMNSQEANQPDPPNAQTSLLPNDVIVMINNTPVTSATDFATVLYATPSTATLDLSIIRNGESMVIQWTQQSAGDQQ